MSPPVPADMSCEVSEGGLVVNGEFLPAGVKVSTPSYCMHMNKGFYPEPYKFRPERWIVDENGSSGASAASVALAESAYMPFSGGPRGCAGKTLAYLEMGLVTAKVLHQFEIRREPNTNVGGGSLDLIEGRREPRQYQPHDIFVGISDGPMVQVKGRTNAGVNGKLQ
jgi:cytochrome P450